MFLPSATTHENEQTSAVLAELDRYCEKHPRSPTALRRPRVMLRGRSCVALIGVTLEDCIAGMGGNVTDALRAFDAAYLKSPLPERG